MLSKNWFLTLLHKLKKRGTALLVRKFQKFDFMVAVKVLTKELLHAVVTRTNLGKQYFL